MYEKCTQGKRALGDRLPDKHISIHDLTSIQGEKRKRNDRCMTVVFIANTVSYTTL